MPGEWVRQHGHGGLRRAIVLLVLLIAPAAAPTAMGQVPEPPPNTFPITLDRASARYEEGETVTITVSYPSTQTQTVRTVRVLCLTGCPEGENAVYEAPVSSFHTFPSAQFCQLINRVRDCTVATSADRYEPRWNGTWAVTLNDAAGLELYRKGFEVSMTDAWKTDYRLEPTHTVRARVGGFQPGSSVTLSFGRLDGLASEVLFRNLTMRANAQGVVSGSWTIPKEQGAALQCEGGHCHKYFAEARAATGSANSKMHERTWYQLYPARMVAALLAGPGMHGQPTQLERTQTVVIFFQTVYPSLAPATDEDVRTSGPNALAVEVQRVDPANGGVAVVARVAPHHLGAGLWIYNWTIPRDLALRSTQGNAFEFRLVVPEARDRWGNHIQRNETDLFAVNAAALPGDWAAAPKTLERQEPGTWLLAPRYYDGQLFDDTVNQTWLSGRFFRVTPQGDFPVPESEVRATYAGNGLWRFDYMFPRGYAYPGIHAFVFDGGRVAANDTWNNHVRSNRSEFNLLPALPAIQLTEKAGSQILNATTGWTRGQSLHITSRITYADGSAYNSSRHFERGVLNVTVEKRRGETEVIETVVVPFRIQNELLGTWAATLPLTLTDRETPAGNWTLRFLLQDRESPPNGGTRSFHRDVGAATIFVEPRRLDQSQYLLGDPVAWRFTLAYPDGRAATDRDIPVLGVDVYRWSGERVLGLERSNVAAEWRPERVWQVVWTPPPGTRLGDFVFIPTGADTFGNRVEARRSDSFRIYVPMVEREVVTQPPESVARNETAYVVFDGLPGDLGENETGCPRISVQRWSREQWVIEVEDVYARSSAGCATGGDHFGAWQTSEGSTLGTYRFAFFGRDSRRAYVNATSASFQVLPLSAVRHAVDQPASVAKGETARMVVSRDRSDQLLSAWVVRHGERLVRADTAYPDLTLWAVSWTPDYRAESGNYTFEVDGRDRNGNAIRAVSLPFTVSEVIIRTEVLEDVPATIRRGETIEWTFRAYLPDDSLIGAVHGAPTVLLETTAGALVAELNPQYQPPNWRVQYRIPMDLPEDVYRLRVLGSDNAGNPFIPAAGQNFTVLPGTVDRSFETPPKSAARLVQVTAAALVNRTDDKRVTCYAAYLGGGAGAQDVRSLPPITTIDVTYAPNPAKGVVDITWTPPRDATMGWYRFDCDGQDAYGNTLRYRSGGFQVGVGAISPTALANSKPQKADFVPGAVLTWRMSLAYADRTPLTPDVVTANSPQFVFTLDGRRIEEVPEASFEATTGSWVVRWVVPDTLLPGKYALQVAGQDVYGNRILTLALDSFDVGPTVTERLFGIPGLDRAVPGPSALVAVAAAVAVAVVVLARRR